MITSHHSFSTRIFLKEAPAAHAGPARSAADADQAENLREFWWFLRSGRGAAMVEGPGLSGPVAAARPAETRALQK
jgi:hypothetical protein